MMRFSEDCRARLGGLWERLHEHEFVRGIGDGSLPQERFRYYLRQDYVFLIDFCRVLALACAKAPELELMQRFAALLESTLGTEMALHREYCAEFGISSEDLAATRHSATTHAYTRHLLATAYGGSFGELVAAILPCQWSYAEIGQRLASAQAGAHRYSRWIDAYASPEFAAMAEWLRAVADRAAREDSPERMRARFEMSTRYELRFWDMSWALES